MDDILLASKRLPGDEALRRLLDYNERTIALYDFGDTERPRPSPLGQVTLEDVGRMVCVGAGLRYQRAHDLMDVGNRPELAWPGQSTTVPPLAELGSSADAVLSRPIVRELADWYLLMVQTKGLKAGTVSKLMHLKWPATIPIADAEFRTLYEDAAQKAHRGSGWLSELSQGRQEPWVPAYWAAFAADLHTSQLGVEALRKGLESAGQGHAPNAVLARRLGMLTDVRLLDILAWSLGRELAR